ncbi:MAG TPA: PilZ domain-containing protein [Terriglobales bacterium]|nr:PilZ domain-containing protein [Terriglobales bacterium]
MQERRGNPRRKMVLPVKVTVGEGAGLAYTLDITSMGARLGGIQLTFEAGQTVTLVRNGRKANFRVVWIREVSPKEIHAGIEAMQPVENFWGVDLTDREQAAKKDMEAMMSLMGSPKKS